MLNIVHTTRLDKGFVQIYRGLFVLIDEVLYGGGDSRLVVVSPPARHEIINILSIVYRYNYLLLYFCT